MEICDGWQADMANETLVWIPSMRVWHNTIVMCSTSDEQTNTLKFNRRKRAQVPKALGNRQLREPRESVRHS